MKLGSLQKQYESVLPTELARDLADEFTQIRRDVSTATLGRSSPGKFVETVVQCLQYLGTGNYEEKPSVDIYLRGCDSKASSLDDGLRICAARIARSMYALRSKRSMMHKGNVDPNSYDLRFLLGGAPVDHGGATTALHWHIYEGSRPSHPHTARAHRRHGGGLR